MKRVLLTCFLLGSASLPSVAQTLQNGDFEQWSLVTTYEPAGWVSNNVYVPQPSIHVTPVSSPFGTGVRLHTTGGFYMPGYIVNTMGNFLNGEGGVPYTGSGIPTHLNGIYRYNINFGDSAYIFVYSKNNGMVVSKDTFVITGTQGSFTSFSFQMKTLAVAPDTILMAAGSGFFNFKPGLGTGSWLELDELTLSNTSGIYPIPHGNFDIWPLGAINVPTDWSTYGDVTPTTDFYSGSMAIKITSKAVAGGVDIANISQGTFPLGNHTDTLIGYYKYIVPAGSSDTATVTAIITDINHTQPPTPHIMQLSPAATYTRFKLPLPTNGVVSDVSFIMSSSIYSTATGGSSLYLDGLQLKSGLPVSVDNINSKRGILLYPNPAQDVVYIKVNEVSEPVHIKITDVRGSIIGEKLSKGAGTITLPLAQLASGVYFCEIRQGETLMREKLVKQ